MRRTKMKLAIWIGLVALMPVFAWSQGSYSTKFPLAENPISEGGKWINGGAVGLDWTNVRTIPGLAFGTELGNSGGNSAYDDSTAVLAGTWGPDQTVQATVAVSNASSSGFQEVELRLRTTITPHSITGYEINGSVSNGYTYVTIVRWNGPLGSFTELNITHAVNTLVTGNILKATIRGSTITAYLNGVQVLQASDNTLTSGSPGIGFFFQGASGLNANYGFSSFTATDDSAPTPPHGGRDTNEEALVSLKARY